MELVLYIFATLSLTSMCVNLLTINTDQNDTDEKSVSINNRTRRTVVVLDKKKLWNGGIIPYEFTYLITDKQQILIRKAMRKWEESTCVQFVPMNRQLHQKYILFTKTKVCECCYLTCGPGIAHKIINLMDQCYGPNTLLHELGHALGFLHEHNHPERDRYISVNYSIIEDDDVIEYQKYSYNQVDTLHLPYDSKSVMHYSRYIIVGKNSVNISVPAHVNQDGLTIINNKLSIGDVNGANLMYHCPQCGKNFFESTGKFGQSTTGSQNDPERCEWRIRASEGHRIILKISSLKIRQSYLCLIDYLEVRNGHSPDSPALERYCGEVNQARIVASNFLVITYVRMSVSGNSFFRAEYETHCEETVDIYNDTIYKIESPNYPNFYMSNKQCQWYFIAPENHQITIKFNIFSLERSKNCTKDFVKIKESNELNSTVLGIYCGLMDSLYVYSTYNKLHVEFSSNGVIGDAGFSAIVNAIKKHH